MSLGEEEESTVSIVMRREAWLWSSVLIIGVARRVEGRRAIREMSVRAGICIVSLFGSFVINRELVVGKP
jgi:hypothetical protein